MPLAVKAGAVATPLALVTTLAVADPLNFPVAPLAGAVNVTVAPLTGLPPLSVTKACNGVANTVLIGAVCGVPPFAWVPATPPVVLVKLKIAELYPRQWQ